MNKKNFCCLLLFVPVCTGMLRAQNKDAALWTGLELEKKFGKQFSGHVKGQFRLNENFTHADYTFLDLGIDYAPNDFVEFTTAYCFNWKNQASFGNAWSLRGQWYANATFTVKAGDFRISNRNQFQTDIEDTRSSASSWFYRNKTGIQYKLNREWGLYASAEAYFRLAPVPGEEDNVYRSRYAAGVKYRIGKRRSLEAGYLIQRQVRRSQPDYIYAVTIGYSQSFK